MGAFYTNVTLYKAGQQDVASFLAKQKRAAYISPTIDNFTVVYDQESESQETDVLEELAESLTRQFHCSGLACLVHDSDVYMYWLYEAGRLLDSYNSSPGYFDGGDESPEGGDVRLLCKAFEKPGAAGELAGLLAAPEQAGLDVEEETFRTAEDIHALLAKALGMPEFSAYVGYDYIERGELPEGLEQENLIKV